MTEEKEKQVWSIDELVTMTETVQSAEIEYAGKMLPVQWCELVESEEPKISVPDDNTPQEEVTEHYKDLAQERVSKMIDKANGMNPEGITITKETYEKIPTTVKWAISGKVLGAASDFISG